MSEIALLILLFAALALARVPIAFAIGIATLVAMWISIPFEPAVTTLSQRIATGLDAFTLLAIPLFILAGELMNRGGLARRLIDFARSLGGDLAQVHIAASMLFGAISGSAIATASAVGSVMEPRLREEGHPAGFRAAVNITAATTGLVIPPSNILIVYSLASGGASIAALFVAGYLPGILTGLALMLVARLRPRVGATNFTRPDRRASLRDALASLTLPAIVIGGIVGGAFTATEASGIAVVLALVLGLVYREITMSDLPTILRDSAASTGTVMLLIGTSIALSWVLAYMRIPQTVAASLLTLTDAPVLLLLLINLTLLVAGTFIDMTPAVLIFTPILLPAAVELGIDPVHFGIVMVMNLCIGLCTPPVGTVLFVGCGVARTSLVSVLRPLLPFYAAMLLALAATTAFPQLSLWLPRALGLMP